MLKKGLITLLPLLFLLGSSSLRAQPVPNEIDNLARAAEAVEFVRFLSGDAEWQGELQTSISRYRNDEGVELDLVAAIHIADGRYYQELNDYFRDRDAVLYELVADSDVRPTRGIETSGGGALSFLQRSMASFLQVDFQLQSVDYSPENFVHADLSPARLEEIMQAKGENFFTMFLSLAMAEMASQQQRNNSGAAASSVNLFSILRAFSAPDQKEAFKFLFAQELARSGGTIVSEELEEQVTILGERNQAALEVLNGVLSNPDNSRISIFYGAAHMAGLARAITTDYGFKPVSQYWLTAWEIP